MLHFYFLKLSLLETYSDSKYGPLFEKCAAFSIIKFSFLCNISTCVFNKYFENYRFFSTLNYRAITHPCLFDWLVWMTVLTKAEIIWQVYKDKLSKTASNFEVLNSKFFILYMQRLKTQPNYTVICVLLDL